MPSASRVVLAALLLGASGCAKIPAGRAAIDEVDVRGAKVLDEDDVEDRLATAASSRFLGLFRGVVFDYQIYDPTVLQRDLARVERFYRGHGFFEAHARAARVEALGADHVRVEIMVEEGPAASNRSLRVNGLEGLPADAADAASSAAQRAVIEGARFDEEAYAQAKTSIARALTDRGYAWAKVTSEASVDVGARAVDYVFVVAPGPRATLGAVTITGLDPRGPAPQEIDEAPLRRAMALEPGAPYSTTAIESATQALLDLEVFSAVEITPALPEPPPRDAVVPVAVRVEPAKLRQIRAGFGAEFDITKTELHILGGWEDHNFLDGLRDFSVDLQPGIALFPTRVDNPVAPTKALPEERLRLSFREPAFLEHRTVGFIKPELNVVPLLVPGIADEGPVIGYVEARGAIGVDRPFGHLYASLAHNVQAEIPFVYVGSVDPASQPSPLFLSYPDLLLRLDYRDDRNQPHEGFVLQNELQVAGGPFGGAKSDVKERPTANAYVPLGRRVTLAAHSSLGFLLPTSYGDSISSLGTNGNARASIDDIQTMYFRGFFGGGPTSNRGFPIRGIAPHGVVPFLTPQNQASLVRLNCVAGTKNYDPSACSIPIGGFTLWEASLETRFLIAGPFSTAVFCDAGDVSPKKGNLRFDRLHLACGAGARYDTPVGPIRLDVGYRLPPLQVLGQPNEYRAYLADPTEGIQPRILGQPIAISFGIGEAY